MDNVLQFTPPNKKFVFCNDGSDDWNLFLDGTYLASATGFRPLIEVAKKHGGMSEPGQNYFFHRVDRGAIYELKLRSKAEREAGVKALVAKHDNEGTSHG